MAKIFPTELQDGLGVFFEKPLSIACSVNLAVADKAVSKVKSVANITGKLKEDEFAYEYASILVTAGIWNKNDQVFDKHEVWKTRYSPLNKPSNLNHQPDKVVAHSNRVFAITDEEEAKLIPDSVDGKPNLDIPDVYHLLTVDTFYKYNIKAYQSVNPEYSKKIQKLYEDISNGNLSVSMECIFANFDYAILYPDGTQKIIERNNDTSYLTKKLKHFGGSGEFQGKRIGLLMRDLMFTGKGITDDPANQASVIFPKDSVLFASQNYAKSEDIFKDENVLAYISNDNGENKMNLEELKAKVTELEAALKAKTSELAEANKLKGELDALKAEFAEKLAKAEQTSKETKEALEAAKKLADENKGKLCTAETELNALKAEKVKTARIEKIKETLGMSKEDAESAYVVIATLDEKGFEGYLTETKKLVVAKNVPSTFEADLAKAKKEVEELNKKLAEEQAKNIKLTDPNLGVAGVVNTDETKKAALKSVFKKD